MNLPLKVGNDPSKGEFPFADSVAVSQTIHGVANQFQTTTLKDAHTMANTLYNYGETSKATFAAVSNLMNQGSADKTTLMQLFGNLKDSTSKYQAAAKGIFDGTKTFADTLATSGTKLTAITQTYVNKAGGLKTQIEKLNLDIKAQHSIITKAQAAITADQKVIKDTVYYSWIPLVGTIIAIAEIIIHEDDIQEQIGNIKRAVTKIQSDNTKLQQDQANMNQLIYAETFNDNQVKLIGDVMPNLQKIEGAWGTISSELGDIMGNIDKAQKASDVPCLADIALTTAVNEWNQVANDSHNFMMNFYVQAAPQKQAA